MYYTFSTHKIKTKPILNEKVVYARVDVGLNELDNVIIDNYPHVRLYKAGVEAPLIQRTDFQEEKLFKWLGEVSNYGHLLTEKNEDLWANKVLLIKHN